jgi:hypothetical protein
MSRVHTVEARLRAWDPIAGSPAGEYDAYATHITSLVQSGCSVQHLRDHLARLRTEEMGLPANPAADLRAAEEIISAVRKQV